MTSLVDLSRAFPILYNILCPTFSVCNSLSTPRPLPAHSTLLLLYLPPCLFAYGCLCRPAFLMFPTSSWPLSWLLSHPSLLRSTTMSPFPQRVSFLLTYQAPPAILSILQSLSPPTISEHSPTVFFCPTPFL